MTMTQPKKHQKDLEKAIKLLTKERSRSWKRYGKLTKEFDVKRQQVENEQDDDRLDLVTIEMNILRDRRAGESRTSVRIDEELKKRRWALDHEKRYEQSLKEEHLKECGR